MKFFLTLKLATRNGGFGQVMSAEHEAPSIEELAAVLNANDFIVVQEFRVDHETGEERPVGPTTLNRRVIGKVREYHPPRGRAREAE